MQFSNREWQILTFLMVGCRNDEIGKRVGITERTVKAYIRSLCFRYGVLPSPERDKILPRIRLAVAIHAAGHCPCGICSAYRVERDNQGATGLRRVKADLPTGRATQTKRRGG